MKNRWVLYVVTLLGVFGAGRLSEAKDSSNPLSGLPSSQKGLPPIDATIPAQTATATFALG